MTGLEQEIEKAVEELSREIHALYMKETKRQGDVRHKDDYDELAENVKEFDRVIARFILEREHEIYNEGRKEGVRTSTFPGNH